MLVGALGRHGRARVSDRGRITPVGVRWSLDWWLGADDRWRVPAHEAAVRQRTTEGAPVVETLVRVPSGDAIERVYGVGGPGGPVVVEVENASPVAFVVAFTVAGARTVHLDGSTLVIDGRPALVLPFAPPRWSTGRAPLEPSTSGASTGPFRALRDRRGRIEVALLYPLSHRSRLRIALLAGAARPGAIDLGGLPTAADVTRGWDAVLERGMRVVLSDPREQGAVDLARAQLLLDPDPDAVATAALEDWGFDAQAAWARRGLSLWARRAAARRTTPEGDGSPAARLGRTRAALIRERPDAVELLPVPFPDWLGAGLEVHDAPTRLGRVSYAVRRHGAGCALLWEVVDPGPGLVLRAPGLDPSWSTTAPRGDALLTPSSFSAR